MAFQASESRNLKHILCCKGDVLTPLAAHGTDSEGEISVSMTKMWIISRLLTDLNTQKELSTTRAHSS